MPVPWSERKTPTRKFGLDDEPWALLQQAARQNGVSTSAYLRQWAEFAVRKSGAKMPARISEPDRN